MYPLCDRQVRTIRLKSPAQHNRDVVVTDCTAGGFSHIVSAYACRADEINNETGALSNGTGSWRVVLRRSFDQAYSNADMHRTRNTC